MLRYFVFVFAACSMVLAASHGAAQMLDPKPGQASQKGGAAYGKASDIKYAKRLWRRLRRARLVGDHRHSARPTKGDQPHGSIQQIIAGKITVRGRRARVIVKANHRGKDVSFAGVFEDPKRFLTGYAVMAKRKKGYDPSNADWFWAVYNPDGSLRKYQGKAIAGRVDTGADNGCIGCHKKYGGKDYEMLTRQ